jgi:hypothetical protein
MGVPALDPAVQQDGQPNQGQEKKPPPEHQEHLLIVGKKTHISRYKKHS